MIVRLIPPYPRAHDARFSPVLAWRDATRFAAPQPNRRLRSVECPRGKWEKKPTRLREWVTQTVIVVDRPGEDNGGFAVASILDSVTRPRADPIARSPSRAGLAGFPIAPDSIIMEATDSNPSPRLALEG
jgi:hypothetical protein